MNFEDHFKKNLSSGEFQLVTKKSRRLSIIWFIFIDSMLLLLAAKSLQSCPTLQPHRRQPTRLLCPWDSPGKNTGVGCHFLLQCMEVKSESEVAQSCPTTSGPMDCSSPGSSWDFPGKSILEWGAIAFSEKRLGCKGKTWVRLLYGFDLGYLSWGIRGPGFLRM